MQVKKKKKKNVTSTNYFLNPIEHDNKIHFL